MACPKLKLVERNQQNFKESLDLNETPEEKQLENEQTKQEVIGQSSDNTFTDEPKYDRLALAKEEAAFTLEAAGKGSFWGSVLGFAGGCLKGALAGVAAGGWAGAILGCGTVGYASAQTAGAIGGAVGAGVGIVKAGVEQATFNPDKGKRSYERAKEWGSVAASATAAVGAVAAGAGAAKDIYKNIKAPQV